MGKLMQQVKSFSHVAAFPLLGFVIPLNVNVCKIEFGSCREFGIVTFRYFVKQLCGAVEEGPGALRKEGECGVGLRVCICNLLGVQSVIDCCQRNS